MLFGKGVQTDYKSYSLLRHLSCRQAALFSFFADKSRTVLKKEEICGILVFEIINYKDTRKKQAENIPTYSFILLASIIYGIAPCL